MYSQQLKKKQQNYIAQYVQAKKRIRNSKQRGGLIVIKDYVLVNISVIRF